MTTYTIWVSRTGKATGKLTYSGSFNLETTCWWDPAKKIPKGVYEKCSATHMSTKLNSKKQKREAIFIPNVKGFSGIFIHMGTSPEWSDGCVVIKESEVLKIWNDITPKNGQNVTVHISNVVINRPKAPAGAGTSGTAPWLVQPDMPGIHFGGVPMCRYAYGPMF